MHNKTQIVWSLISTSGTAVVFISYFIIASQSTSYNGGNAHTNMIMGWLVFAGIIVSILNLMAILKVKKWLKLIPITCLLVCLSIVTLAYIAYSFLQHSSITF